VFAPSGTARGLPKTNRIKHRSGLLAGDRLVAEVNESKPGRRKAAGVTAVASSRRFAGRWSEAGANVAAGLMRRRVSLRGKAGPGLPGFNLSLHPLGVSLKCPVK